MNKPDYAYKSRILNEGINKLVAKNEKHIYLDYVDDTMFERFIFCAENHINILDYDEGYKINKSSYQRVQRLRDRIKWYLSLDKCYFITLTFNDDTLSSTNELTRRKYVRRWLKMNSLYYVANIDYGGKNGREHYHAVVCPYGCYMNYDTWHIHGAIKSELIIKPSNDDTNKKLAKYISKLTNHAIKETTRRNTMIYSRTPVQY